MRDYIERETVLKIIGEPGPFDYEGKRIRFEVSTVPGRVIPKKAKLKRKRSRWIDGYLDDMPVQICERCGTFFPLAYTGGGHKYCPACGARMDLGGENDGK